VLAFCSLQTTTWIYANGNTRIGVWHVKSDVLAYRSTNVSEMREMRQDKTKVTIEDQ